jgi:hypothetical protein
MFWVPHVLITRENEEVHSKFLCFRARADPVSGPIPFRAFLTRPLPQAQRQSVQPATPETHREKLKMARNDAQNSVVSVFLPKEFRDMRKRG